MSEAAIASRATDWIRLAAAPTFAIMALLTAVPAGGPAEMLCSAGHAASPLSGMVTMYLLMSAFHTAPWLRLLSSRRSHLSERALAHPSPRLSRAEHK